VLPVQAEHVLAVPSDVLILRVWSADSPVRIQFETKEGAPTGEPTTVPYATLQWGEGVAVPSGASRVRLVATSRQDKPLHVWFDVKARPA
jgi:hypothetical protein